MRCRSHAFTLGLTILLFIPLSPLAAPLESAQDLPGDAEDALDDNWSGWRVLQPDRIDRTCRPQSDGGASTMADFDGDGRSDYAVYIEAGQRLHLVVLLSRVREFQAHEVELPAPAPPVLPIGIEPRGKQYRPPGFQLEKFLSADTLALYRCGGEMTLYQWIGFRFQRLDLGRAEN